MYLQRWNGPARHPEVAVRSLLTEVLNTIEKETEDLTDFKGTILDYSRISALAENSTLRSILAETCELAAVDIKLLAPGVETHVFYTNLANLMWIHSLLTLELVLPVEDNPVIPKQTGDPEVKRNFRCGLLSSYSLERQIFRKSIGYNVGNLGFISLSEVYQQLLQGLYFPSASVLKNYTILGSLSCLKASVIDSTSADPRVLFSLMNDQRESPKCQVSSAIVKEMLI